MEGVVVSLLHIYATDGRSQTICQMILSLRNRIHRRKKNQFLGMNLNNLSRFVNHHVLVFFSGIEARGGIVITSILFPIVYSRLSYSTSINKVMFYKMETDKYIILN